MHINPSILYQLITAQRMQNYVRRQLALDRKLVPVQKFQLPSKQHNQTIHKDPYPTQRYGGLDQVIPFRQDVGPFIDTNLKRVQKPDAIYNHI